MRIINKKYLLIILLVGIILTSVIIFKPIKEVKLDNVILKQEVNNKTFAMYKEESENNYVPVEGTEFPKMYVLNLTESKCIDNNGNEIKDALSYENNTVTITSGNTTYCYLYFDKSLGLEIKDKNPNGLKTDKERGAMYRFQGQAKDAEGNELIDNYICFGTDENCSKTAEDIDKYMYRIIGIEASTGRVKVIKKEVLNETVPWWDNYNDDIEFPESKIYETISGSNFLENTDYVPVDEENNINWEEKISNNTWMYGDMVSNSTDGARQTGEELYKVETGQKGTIWDEKANEGEPGAQPYTVEYEGSPYQGQVFYYIRHNNEEWIKTFSGKVSLMYLHDYYYSVSDEANCQYNASNYTICKTGWMNLSQNDSSALSGFEWTMTRYGWNTVYSWFNGNYVYNEGYTRHTNMINDFSIRPVFYINASEKLLDGTGTITDPFIIK